MNTKNKNANVIIFDQRKSKTVNQNSAYMLLGNNIDGTINFDKECFKNFNEVKENLESVLENVKGEGEWDIVLYAVEDLNVKLKYTNLYYKQPKRGKSIFRFSYMNWSQENSISISDKTIELKGITFSPKTYSDQEDTYYITDEVTKLNFV